MSLRNLTALVLLAVVFAVEFSYGSFCDDGPPGRYCFVDLSGWYECTLDNKTQKMTQKEHQCPTNTRCLCFYGPSCPDFLKDPCGRYELPPPFPDAFSSFYIKVVTTCGPQGCSNVTHPGEIFQNATAGELRHDRVKKFWETQFVFPFNYIEDTRFFQFDVYWMEKNCTLTSRSTFPRLEVPAHFTCNQLQLPNKDNATYTVCSWQYGGHNQKEEVITEKWLLQPLADGRYIPAIHDVKVLPTPSSKTSVFYETIYLSFFNDLLDPSQLIMPAFCGRATLSLFKNEA